MGVATQSLSVEQKKWYRTVHHIEPDPVFGKGYESFKKMGAKLKGYPQEDA